MLKTLSEKYTHRKYVHILRHRNLTAAITYTRRRQLSKMVTVNSHERHSSCFLSITTQTCITSISIVCSLKHNRIMTLTGNHPRLQPYLSLLKCPYTQAHTSGISVRLCCESTHLADDKDVRYVSRIKNTNTLN